MPLNRTALPLFIAAAFCAAVASEARLRLIAAEVRYDPARWSAAVSETAISFAPRGAAEREHGTVVLRVVADDAPCAILAERTFGLGPYDVSDLRQTEATVGGLAAERFMAHTRCRNATSEGVVVCVKHEGRAYLLESLQMSCRDGRNLFSGADPLAEIAAGMTFDAE